MISTKTTYNLPNISVSCVVAKYINGIQAYSYPFDSRLKYASSVTRFCNLEFAFNFNTSFVHLRDRRDFPMKVARPELKCSFRAVSRQNVRQDQLNS